MAILPARMLCSIMALPLGEASVVTVWVGKFLITNAPGLFNYIEIKLNRLLLPAGYLSFVQELLRHVTNPTLTILF